MKTTSLISWLVLSAFIPQLSTASAQGTAITYQGRLVDGGAPADGTYDLRFAVYDAPTGGNAVGAAVTNAATPVSGGMFTASLDFGAGVFNGADRWLLISVRTNGAATFVTLTPRQRLTPEPYALYAPNAGLAATATTASAVAADGVASAGIQNDAVTSAKIADGTIAPSDLSPIVLNSTFWKVGGNADTTPAANFIGTTDNQALAVKVNNAIVLQFMPGSTLPNLVGGLGGFRPSVLATGVSGAVIVGGNAPSGGVNGGGAGDFHAVYDNDGTVGGGFGNKVGSNNGDITDGAFATVAGGVFNSAANYAATVCGGDGNFAGGQRSFIGGGYANQARASFSAAGGGLQNSILDNADYAIIGGGANNSIAAFSTYGTIGGGSDNNVADNSTNATIAGGGFNDIGTNSHYSAIGGGNNNNVAASSVYSTIAGGSDNSIRRNSDSSAIGGGYRNLVRETSTNATIAGGFGNGIGTNSNYSAIGGGYGNNVAANSLHATIPGGANNFATNFAFAAGNNAKAYHSGAFVWADSQFADFASTADNQFNVRASGGIRVSDDTPAISFGAQTRQMINLWGTQYGIGVQSSAAYFRTDNEFFWYRGGSHSDTFGDAGAGGTPLMRLGSTGSLIIAGTLSQGSDRNIKQDFTAVDPQEVLEKVAALPIQTWTYTNDVSRRHLGPVAQDFHAAFGLNGADDKHITTVDADGVALAAIQGLNEKLEVRSERAEGWISKLEEKLKRRDAENAELKQRLDALERITQHQ